MRKVTRRCHSNSRRASPGFVHRLVRGFVQGMRVRSKLLVGFGLVILLQTVVGLATYGIARARLLQMDRELLDQSVVLIGRGIDHYLDIYRRRVNAFANNTEFRSLLEQDELDLYAEAAIEIRVQTLMLGVTGPVYSADLRPAYDLGRPIVCTVYTTNAEFSEEAGVILPMSLVEDEAWVRDLRSSPGLSSWSTTRDSSGLHLVVSSRMLQYTTRREIGIVRLAIPSERIEGLIAENLDIDAHTFALISGTLEPVIVVGRLPADDINATVRSVVQRPRDEMPSMFRVAGENSLLGLIDSAIPGWRYLYVVGAQIVRSRLRPIAVITIAAMFLTIVVSVLISAGIAQILVTRIGVLVRKTSLINRRRTTAPIVLKGDDEVALLDRNLNRMLDRLNDLISREYRTNVLLATERLTTLQEHLNPHLMNNALSTIRGLARDIGQERIADLSGELMRFYRDIISDTSLLHTFAAEMELVDAYVELASDIYEVDVEYQTDVSQEALGLYCLRMLLQPIVENSILHGLRPIGSGAILINVSVHRGEVRIAVSDTGCGIDDSRLAHLRGLSSGRSQASDGFGLTSVVRRLRIFFGTDAVVDIESGSGIGTSILMRMPVVNNPDVYDVFETRPNGFPPR